MKKRTLAMLLAGVLCLSLLAGCGTPASKTDDSGASPADETKAVELSVVTSYGGDDGNRGNYEAAIKAYEEASGNKVLDASATSNEEWKAKVMSDFESGTEPDVLFYFSNADSDAIVNGALADPSVTMDAGSNTGISYLGGYSALPGIASITAG